DFFTRPTILRGVIVGPDGYFRGSFCPVASSLTFVPPTSITRTLGDFAVFSGFMAAPQRITRRGAPRRFFPCLEDSRGKSQFSEENSQTRLGQKPALRNFSTCACLAPAKYDRAK